MKDTTKEVFKVSPTKEIATSIVGNFVLERKISDSKRQKFRLSNLTSEVPFGKTIKERFYFFDGNGQAVNSFMIDKVKMYLYPDTSQVDRLNLLSLMKHTDVRIGSMTDDEHKQLVKAKLKNSNPKYVLINIDAVKNEAYEAEKVIALASNKIYTCGYNSKQLGSICALFGVPYSIEESQESSKVPALEQRLVKWSKISKENAQKVIDKLEDLTIAEYFFYFDQLVRFEILKEEHGFYRLSDSSQPIGINKEQVIKFLQENPEKYNMLKFEVQEYYKQ